MRRPRSAAAHAERGARQCLAPTHEERTFVGATHASPSISSRACGGRARQCLAPTHEERTFVGATHASPSISSRACGERARQCLARAREEGTFVGATHASPSSGTAHAERGRGNASPLHTKKE